MPAFSPVESRLHNLEDVMRFPIPAFLILVTRHRWCPCPDNDDRPASGPPDAEPSQQSGGSRSSLTRPEDSDKMDAKRLRTPARATLMLKVEQWANNVRGGDSASPLFNPRFKDAKYLKHGVMVIGG